MDYFSERLLEAQRRKRSVAMLGVDPQLDAPGAPGLPEGYTLSRFCCANRRGVRRLGLRDQAATRFFRGARDGRDARADRSYRARAPAGVADRRRRQARRYRLDPRPRMPRPFLVTAISDATP